MKVENKTHYHSYFTRTYNDVPETNSFAYEASRRLSFEQRLNFEYKDTCAVGGRAYFITCTYNDASIPQYFGKNVFSYDDIRLITNGNLVKKLFWKFGCDMRYFCACETGEGGVTHDYVGVRGAGNNPHLHFLFFVRPADPLKHKTVKPDKFPKFVVPTGPQFLELVREVWQYKDGKHTDWNRAFKGHVEAGNNAGVVDRSDCFGYVSKYVTKDSASKETESFVYSQFTKQVCQAGLTSEALYAYYDSLVAQDSTYTIAQFEKELHLDEFDEWRRSFPDEQEVNKVNYWYFLRNHVAGEVMVKAWKLNHWFYHEFVPQKVATLFRDFKNQHGNKVRCSKSLGIAGLSQIKNVDTYEPTFEIITSSQIKTMKPCLYYLRKLYYEVVKCPHTDNPLYILTEKGVAWKKHNLKQSLNNYTNTLASALAYYRSNTSEAIDTFKHKFVMQARLLDSFDYKFELGWAYSCYKLVYENRHYMLDSELALTNQCRIEDVLQDYGTFLRCSYWSFDYCDTSCKRVLSLNHDDLTFSFAQHLAFKPFVELFRAFDAVMNLYNKFNSDRHKKAFEEHSTALKKINECKFNLKYCGASQFLTL